MSFDHVADANRFPLGRVVGTSGWNVARIRPEFSPGAEGAIRGRP